MALPTTRGPQLDELVRAHQNMLRGFLRFLGCPVQLTDDVCQDVFLSVLSAPFEFRSEGETAAYLRKVARHLFLKTMQRERRRCPNMEPSQAETAWLSFAREDEGHSYKEALRDCLRLLTGRPAEVIRLRYHEGLRRDAIRARLGLSEGGVKSILVRTRARLRECVERKAAPE